MNSKPTVFVRISTILKRLVMTRDSCPNAAAYRVSDIAITCSERDSADGASILRSAPAGGDAVGYRLRITSEVAHKRCLGRLRASLVRRESVAHLVG